MTYEDNRDQSYMPFLEGIYKIPLIININNG